jgi:autoinducer 2-degrading protein
LETCVKPDIGTAKRHYAITVAFELEDGAQAEFLPLIYANAEESVRSEAGCLRFDVLTAFPDPAGSTVLLYEIYINRAAFDLHLASSHFKLFDRQSAALVAKKTVNDYNVVENFKDRS